MGPEPTKTASCQITIGSGSARACMWMVSGGWCTGGLARGGSGAKLFLLRETLVVGSNGRCGGRSLLEEFAVDSPAQKPPPCRLDDDGGIVLHGWVVDAWWETQSHTRREERGQRASCSMSQVELKVRVKEA